MELVATSTAGVLQAPSGPAFLSIEFCYTSDDPAAVYLHIQTLSTPDAQPVTWVIGRELMDEAMAADHEVGLGQVAVQVLEAQNKVRFILYGTGGEVCPIYVELDPVIDFMIAVLQAAPPDAPAYDVDEAIEKILAGAR